MSWMWNLPACWIQTGLIKNLGVTEQGMRSSKWRKTGNRVFRAGYLAPIPARLRGRGSRVMLQKPTLLACKMTFDKYIYIYLLIRWLFVLSWALEESSWLEMNTQFPLQTQPLAAYFRIVFICSFQFIDLGICMSLNHQEPYKLEFARTCTYGNGQSHRFDGFGREQCQV